MKKIIVIGSNRGLGEAIVRNLCDKPYHIIMAFRRQEQAEATLECIAFQDFRKLNKLQTLQLDITNSQSIDNFVSKMKTEPKKINVLLNNAGVNSNNSKKSFEEAKKILDTISSEQLNLQKK